MKNKYLAKAGSTALATLIIVTSLGVPAQAATPSPNVINTYSRAEVAAAYASKWLPTTTSPINWTGDAASCNAGTESADSLAKGAQAINFYRGLAGLDSISLSSSQNTLAQQTALLMEANGQISHNPTSSWNCYTTQGAQGAATSNLFGGTGNFTINSAGTPIKAYMDENGSNNAPVGHRRWVLNPSTVTMGMGTTKGFNALNIVGAPTDAARTNPTMISFPSAGYFPQQLEPNGKWSVSSAQGVDFSGATVSVKDANGTALGVVPLSTAEGYGPNTISFQVQGLAYASGASEAAYKVTVDNMKKNNLPFSYSYTVRLFDGTVSTSSVVPADPMPTLPTPVVTVVAQSPTFGATNYVIPTTTGVAYKVNGVVTQAGTYNASTPITITAEAASAGYAITGAATWSKDFTPIVVQPINVTPTAPTFGTTTYTIPYKDGVDYKVNGGSTLQGTYTASAPVTITAVALSGYTLSGTTTWSKDYTPADQLTQVTPVAPTLSATSYTIPTVTGVDYLVEGNVKAAGTYSANTKITITAVAKTGYVISGTATWTKDFTPVVAQPTQVTPVAPTLGAMSYTIPTVAGVDYLVNNSIKAAGTYSANTKITITAVAKTGYVLSGTATWTKDFTPVKSEIAAKAAALNGGLGAATTGEVYGLKNGGGYQCFQHGCIIWSPSTGAHISMGGIRSMWALTGYENGGLGYPTSDEIGGLKNGGVYQTYQGGVVYWSPASGATISVGGIRALWGSLGYENGYLGYPTSNEIGGLKNGGVAQIYQGGVVYWSPATGAHVSVGGIRALWGSLGYENGYLGYPTSNEIGGLRNGGVYQTYQGGVVYWSPASGAHVSVGGIRAMWATTGYEKGYLGYPTSNEIGGLKNGGVAQIYQGGVVYWSPATGAYVSTGGIRAMWGATGYENGRLGYPTSNEYVTSAGNVAQNYQGGTIKWGSRGNTIVYK